MQSVYNVGQNSVSVFTQRVMSAKLLRVKQLQNQLFDTQNQLNELVSENRLLRTLQKRQAIALHKFDSSQDQLPQLIKSHNEEIRILNSKFKLVKERFTDLETRLKRKDAELSYLKEHHKHLLQLSQDKQLVDREKLAKKVEILEAREKEQCEKIQLLTRKLELEGKNYRYQLNSESNKLRETQNDLKSALGTINNLKAAIEAKEKYVNCTMPKKYQKSMEHLLQNSHVSLPIPPRVSIRQTDKLPGSEPSGLNAADSSSDSDIYSNIFNEKYSVENDDNRSSSKPKTQFEDVFGNDNLWGLPDQDSKSNSSNDLKERKTNQSDDSLDGLKINRSEGKKKKRLFTNVAGDGREMNTNYSFSNTKLDNRFIGRNPMKSNETLARIKPRSRSVTKMDLKSDGTKTHKLHLFKKGLSSKHYHADRESSADEPRANSLSKGGNNNIQICDNIEINSSLGNFHQEMKYELEQVIMNESKGLTADAEEDVFENCEPAMGNEVFSVNPSVEKMVHSDKLFTEGGDGLNKFSNLTWNQIKDEISSSKQDVINILDKANKNHNMRDDQVVLGEEKKANLLKMLNDIDNDEESRDDKYKQLNREDEKIKISKTKKKHILQEIFH